MREFWELTFARAGSNWCARGRDRRTGATVIEVDPRYFRPAQVEFLLGDSTKARTKLGWTPRFSFESLVDVMVDSDMALAAREVRVRGGAAVGMSR